MLKITEINIRNVKNEDFKFILNLNHENVEVLSPMDQNQLLKFINYSDLFLIVEVDNTPAAFIICLREGIEDYGSENYTWFSDNYSEFLYIDRIVIDRSFRKLGIGKLLYDKVFEHARKTGVGFVTAEIDLIPYNGSSLIFHEKMGFTEVGTQYIRDGEVKVSLQQCEIT